MTRPRCRLLRASLLFASLHLGFAADPASPDLPTPTPPVVAKVILTPKPAATPRINGPKVFGVRPDAPFLYSIPATGDRPMRFSVEQMPSGLVLDAQTGRISGVLSSPGEYKTVLHATNALGTSEKPFRIIVGEDIALTPAMGWNSYNCFGVHITQDQMLRAARAIVALGLDQHGWTYVNMDDGWQGQRGGPSHALQADPQAFPDVKAMVDQIHALGLKVGLYSTPWTVSYGRRTGGSSVNAEGTSDPSVNLKAKRNEKVLPYSIGPYSFTKVDAEQFAQWGFDYLKYDWGPVEVPETKEMYEALRGSGRDIVLSLSNNHTKTIFSIIGDLSRWAESWRTTSDISDNWKRVALDIGFAQDPWAPFARPGHFNDADMLVVGHVGGWKNETRPSRLSPDEQYTHISLWCLLSSPLLMGCDLEQMDDFTLSLLTNDDVLEVNQDSLGRQATQVGGTGDLKVYAKSLEDGSIAVGLFNTSETEATVSANWSDLKLSGKQRVRDLWRQRNLGVFADHYEAHVPHHGVVLLRISPES